MQSRIDSEVHIFDCDGVILNSNRLKLEALKDTLEAVNCAPAFVRWATEEFRVNFGRTRAKHFEVFSRCNDISDFNFTFDMAENALEIYGKKVMDLYEKCDIITETGDYISQLSSIRDVWVVSASDQSELRGVLPHKVKCIKSSHVFGGPISKKDNIRKVMELVGGGQFCFYGDAVQDAKAALENGVRFIGLTKYAASPSTLKDFCRKEGLDFYDNCLEVKG